MAIKNFLLVYLFPVLTLGQRLGFLDALPGLPSCGADCIVNAAPVTDCSLANITCICADESFKHQLQICVEEMCSVDDRLAMAREDAELCHIPRRSRRAELLAVISIAVIAFFALLLRLYSRWHFNKKYGVDDWIMATVAVIYVPFLAIGNYAAMLGFGVDTWYIDPDDLTLAMKLFYISETLYLALLGLTKVSIIFFYLRIFPNPRFRLLCWVVMCWVLVATTTFVVLQIFQCTPLSAIWEAWEGNYPVPYHCFDVNALVYAAAGFSVVQDIVILVMPLPLLLKLNTNWRRKIGIVFMFSLGIFVLATSSIRLRFMVQFARSINPSWDYTDSLIWSGIEVAVSIIVASLPAIRALLARMWPRFFSTSARKSSGRPSETAEPKNPPSGMSARLGGGKRPARSPQSRLFSMLAKTRGEGEERDAPNESQLELGDRIRGDTQTGIGLGNSPVGVYDTVPERLTLGSTIGTSFLDDESRGPSWDSNSPTSPIIHKETTTTRMLGSNQIRGPVALDD